MLDTYDNCPRQIQVTLTRTEYDILEKIIRERQQQDKKDANIIDSLVKRAKRLKQTAERLYPKSEFECYVIEDTEQIHFDVVCDDESCLSVNTAEVLLTVNKEIYKEDNKDKSQRRIYV